MISSPALASVSTVSVSANWPDAVANAPTPPSSAAIRCSNTSVVGFMMRV